MGSGKGHNKRLSTALATGNKIINLDELNMRKPVEILSLLGVDFYKLDFKKDGKLIKYPGDNEATYEIRIKITINGEEKVFVVSKYIPYLDDDDWVYYQFGDELTYKLVNNTSIKPSSLFKKNIKEIFNNNKKIDDKFSDFSIRSDTRKWRDYIQEAGLSKKSVSSHYLSTNVSWGSEEISYVYTELMRDLMEQKCLSFQNWSDGSLVGLDGINASDYIIEYHNKGIQFGWYDDTFDEKISRVNTNSYLILRGPDNKIISSKNTRYKLELKKGSLMGGKPGQYSDFTSEINMLWRNAIENIK